MPKICYVPKKFSAEHQNVIDLANAIITKFRRQGYLLTLRQLYYQFVAGELLPNTQKSYKRLGDIISSARLAGLIDWEAIEDRTRSLETLPTWTKPESILEVCARDFRRDKWIDQDVRVEVWIEKQALEGVFERICNELEVPYFSCRGYTSQSEMWAAAMRLKKYEAKRQTVHVLHFGDHDPAAST